VEVPGGAEGKGGTKRDKCELLELTNSRGEMKVEKTVPQSKIA